MSSSFQSDLGDYSQQSNQDPATGLAVANLADEESLEYLPQAKDGVLVENATRDREEQTKQFKARILLGIICMMVLLVIILIAVLGSLID